MSECRPFASLLRFKTILKYLNSTTKIYIYYRPKDVKMWAVYFGFSVFYLTSRTFFVLYIAALINDASVAPLKYIRKIPPSGWCVEAQRFAEQINYDCIALTGNKFFFMTRGLVFAVST